MHVCVLSRSVVSGSPAFQADSYHLSHYGQSRNLQKLKFNEEVKLKFPLVQKLNQCVKKGRLKALDKKMPQDLGVNGYGIVCIMKE